MGVETALIAAAAVSAASSVAKAGQEYAANKRAEKMAKQEEKALKVQRARDLADLERQRGASAAAMRAMLAATGQADTASADALVSEDAANFGRSNARMLQDYTIQGGVLKARTREFGRAATSALIQGTLDVAGAGARGRVSVFRAREPGA